MMIQKRLVLMLALLLLPPSAQGQAPPLPIIDMHLHAAAASAQGPPPVAMCTPMDPAPVWDPARPYSEVTRALLKNPPCEDPMWSPETDKAVMAETVEIMRRRNIYGVLSGPPERVTTWMAEAPDRFYPGFKLWVGRENVPPRSLRSLHEAGRLAVLAEVSSQYSGIAPDDERMEPYWVYVMHAGYPPAR